jgi:large subunit ribosomal protein L25
MASTKVTLDAAVREVFGKKVKHLRAQGQIPGTVYGKGFEPVSVTVDDKLFNTVYRRVGKTALVDLNIGKKMQSVFVQEVQRHPLKRHIIHIDFKVVDLKVAIQIEVPIVAVGESPIVARGDALLNHVLNSVLVEALPAELPQHIEVDISDLDELDKSIHVRDVHTEKGFKILNDEDQVLLSLTQVRAVEEEEAPAEEAAEPELIRRGREEEGEGEGEEE